MKTTILGLTVLVVLAAGSAHAAMFETTKLTVCVVDDLGRGVPAADVNAGYFGSREGGRGLTDTNGVFRFAGKAVASLNCTVKKAGFYQTGGELWSGPSSAGMVPPVNAYTVVLKRIVHPVPMLERKLSLEFPALDRPVGLDLAVGDWIAPNGKGLVADLWVRGHRDLQDARNWEFRCQWQFANDNGVVAHRHPGSSSLAIASRLIPPLEAPMTGFTNQYEFFKWYHAGRGSERSASVDDHLLFQVRCQKDDSGRLLSRNVGWIKGGMSLEGRETETMWIRFDYYYNPDPHSRSLEPEEIAKRQAGP